MGQISFRYEMCLPFVWAGIAHATWKHEKTFFTALPSIFLFSNFHFLVKKCNQVGSQIELLIASFSWSHVRGILNGASFSSWIFTRKCPEHLHLNHHVDCLSDNLNDGSIAFVAGKYKVVTVAVLSLYSLRNPPWWTDDQEFKWISVENFVRKERIEGKTEVSMYIRTPLSNSRMSD